MKTLKKIILGLITVFLILNIHATLFYKDTRIGSGRPEESQSLVYAPQQSFGNNSQAYGDIEFTNGISLYPTSPFAFDIVLGIQPPIAGTLRYETGLVAEWQITVSHDLTLSITGFEPGISGNTMNFLITPNPYSIFLTRNITIPIRTNIGFESGSGGILNGLSNTITIAQGSAPFTAGLTFTADVPNGLTVKDVRIIIPPGNLIFLTNGAGPLTFEDVQLLVFSGVRQGMFSFFTYYSGLNNVIGDGGFFQFANDGFHQQFTQLNSETRLYVSPNTTMALVSENQIDPHGKFYFLFQDKTSELFLDNCTLQIGGFTGVSGGLPAVTNMTFTAGTMVVNGNVNLTSGAGASSLQLGDGVHQANNFDVIILPGSKLIVAPGMKLINKNV